ncbi:MAG TPA: formate dehydrogenase accessory sulfurtransferase FdhD [Blastocatellia bacterium]|nr:formate dehydrogenase accessory sulfurtransferase FdhD [Blastocatellia bacterium]
MSVVEVPVHKINGAHSSAQAALTQDALAVEEPLEIRLSYEADGQRETKSLSITMRTPGHDFDLAAGFLFTEGIIERADQIAALQHCGGQDNVVKVTLASDVQLDFARLQRHFYTSSSCGVCGKTSIEALQATACPTLPKTAWAIDVDVIHALPDKLRAAQSVFDATGGLHAAALFDANGTLVDTREDVGRHNAVDKLIGAQFRVGQTPLQERLLLVSGRASFELVQKALMGGLPILAAVGAPSSLAVELAQNFGMTLVGFVRDGRFNIYAGVERINIPRVSVAVNATDNG